MNTTTTQFLRSDPAMYTSPGRVGVRDPARMYVRGRIFFLAPSPLYVRVHATCAPLLRHVRASTSTSMYVHVRDQNVNATYASTRWVPTVRHFLACEDVAGGSQQSGARNTVADWWVPAIRWRNNYFARNKEALPCCGRGPSCQPLHVQSTSDGSHSLTTLTTQRREHHGGGRRRGLGKGRRGAGEDMAVDAHAERRTRVYWFGCGVRLPSPQNNRGCW